MGKVEFFTIILSKDTPIYLPSEQLKGTVNFRIKERFKINSVKMRVIGGSRVQWYKKLFKIFKKSYIVRVRV